MSVMEAGWVGVARHQRADGAKASPSKRCTGWTAGSGTLGAGGATGAIGVIGATGAIGATSLAGFAGDVAGGSGVWRGSGVPDLAAGAIVSALAASPVLAAPP